MSAESQALLTVRGLRKRFNLSSDGWLSKEEKYLHAVNGVDFEVHEGETFGIVGESGCGKSTLGNMIMNLLEPSAGQIVFAGVDRARLSGEEARRARRHMQMVFQDPFSSLNPRMRVFDIIAEPLRTHHVARGEELKHQVFDLLSLVGLNRDAATRYPHEFSGGQRQRIVIARALALKPKMIVCDEPVSALDVSIQAQILNLLMSLQKELKLTYVFIAHGLPAVKYISDRVAVMYLGKIVELAPKEALFNGALHPYTSGLLSAVPVADPRARLENRERSLKGELPNPLNLPPGCRFASRCPFATDLCKTDEPPLREHQESHYVSCHFPGVAA
ncbi:ABC transporter ATP-binding protein (plasmid) [Nitratireductor aquimarinus]|uniref:ABC transporter ATP-binding protein n=1 Tax=Nitratireductor aquimarinus TaxID=889300 RepID=UPI00398F131A